MKKSLFGLQLEILKEKNIIKDVNYDSLKAIQDVTLDYIQSLPLWEIQRRIESVTVEDLLSNINQAHAKSLLQERGIVIIKNFFDERAIIESADYVQKITSSFKTLPLNWEAEKFIYNCSEFAVALDSVGLSYYELANYEKPIIELRTGISGTACDAGILDVFNVDRLVDKIGIELRSQFLCDSINNLVSEYEPSISAQNLNMYLNTDVLSTRGFHVDGYYRSLKAFSYAQNIETLDQGPFCYVAGSHLTGNLFALANKALTKNSDFPTEAPIVDLNAIVPCLANPKSMILCDVQGIHRGIPQQKGNIRRLFVMRWK